MIIRVCQGLIQRLFTAGPKGACVAWSHGFADLLFHLLPLLPGPCPAHAPTGLCTCFPLSMKHRPLLFHLVNPDTSFNLTAHITSPMRPTLTVPVSDPSSGLPQHPAASGTTSTSPSHLQLCKRHPPPQTKPSPFGSQLCSQVPAHTGAQ